MTQQNTQRLIIFAKTPLKGLVKTRLIPALGEQGAAVLADQLIQHSLASFSHLKNTTVEYCVAPSAQHSYWQCLPQYLRLTEQGEGNLGERMARALQRGLQEADKCLIIGTDCPALTADIIEQAFKSLDNYDACINPVIDGGYALLGLTQFSSTLFTNIPWSTEQVADLTRQKMAALTWSFYELPELADIDRPDDLALLDKYFHTS